MFYDPLILFSFIFRLNQICVDGTASFSTRTVTVVQKKSPTLSIIVPISEWANRYIIDDNITSDFWEYVSKFRARTRVKFEKIYAEMFSNLRSLVTEDLDLLSVKRKGCYFRRPQTSKKQRSHKQKLPNMMVSFLNVVILIFFRCISFYLFFCFNRINFMIFYIIFIRLL